MPFNFRKVTTMIALQTLARVLYRLVSAAVGFLKKAVADADSLSSTNRSSSCDVKVPTLVQKRQIFCLMGLNDKMILKNWMALTRLR